MTSMQKDSWPAFISEKIRIQVTVENARKVQTWAFGVLALVMMMQSAAAFNNIPGRAFLLLTQFLFVTAFHILLSLGVYLPQKLQKGAKVFSRMLSLRDFTSLIFMTLSLGAITAIVFQASFQVIHGAEELQATGMMIFFSWANLLTAGIYLAGFVLMWAGMIFMPGFLARSFEKLSGRPGVFALLHGVLAVMSLISYSHAVEIGSAPFFEQFRLVVLFWMTLVAVVSWMARVLEESSLPALQSLELEIASSKIERSEDVLFRFKQAFMSRRLIHWVEKLAEGLAKISDEISQCLQQCVTVAAQAKPTEAQLAWMEDRYRRAVSRTGRMARHQQKFLLALSFLNLLEVEEEQVETLKDAFSKEIRHAKLEVAGVRKKLD